jgi:hypothetical protein
MLIFMAAMRAKCIEIYLIVPLLGFKAICTEFCLPLAEWLGLEVNFLRVMGPIPTQWTSTYVLLSGRWLNKLLRPPGLVDTVDRWENSTTYAK